jgi:hypothetical protein
MRITPGDRMRTDIPKRSVAVASALASHWLKIVDKLELAITIRYCGGHDGMVGSGMKTKKGARKDYSCSSVPDLASSIASATSTLSNPSPNAVLRSVYILS